MSQSEKSTDVVNWVCHSLALLLCAARLGMRAWRRQKYAAGEWWTMVAMTCIIIRVVFFHITIMWGFTTTLTEAQRKSFTPQEFNRLTIASKISMTGHLILPTLLWSLKLVVLDLCRRLIYRLAWEKPVLWTFRITFGVTYIISLLPVALECRPFHLYWQLDPDPGVCVKALKWLLTYETCNILTDIMLLALPFPVIMRLKTKMVKRLQLCSLFGLGVFLIVISIVRIVQYYAKPTSSAARTIWADLETLFACVVAQVPTLYTLFGAQYGSTSSSNYRSYNHTNGITKSQQRSRAVRGSGIELGERAYGAYRAEGYTEMNDNRRRAEMDGQESLKGIMHTVEITQETETNRNHSDEAIHEATLEKQTV